MKTEFCDVKYLKSIPHFGLINFVLGFKIVRIKVKKEN